MQTGQINARLNIDLKREGDAVLARFGTSATEAIRSLWSYLAQTKQLPDFMAHKDVTVQENVGTCTAPVDGAGLALRMASERGLATGRIQELSYQDLRVLAFEELIEEDEAYV